VLVLKAMKLFIFGSTGDLVKRKIIPAFRELQIDDLEIIALGRKNFNQETYQGYVCNGDDCFEDFKNKPQYHKIEFGESLVCEHCGEFLERGKINYFYSAMPPQNLESILRYLGKLKREGFQVRALLEKPFGNSLVDALNLKELAILENVIDDIDVADHYLFKEEIVSMNPRDFKKLKIVSLEKVGLENRISYYDGVGALKDMVQSHLLNITFKIFGSLPIRSADFKVEVYERGQYEGYVDELGKPSETETFVKVIISSNGKELELVTGKKFDKKSAYICIDGKKVNLISEKNAYTDLFVNFLGGKKENFVSVDTIVGAWEIVEEIQKKKSKLFLYKTDSLSEDFCQ